MSFEIVLFWSQQTLQVFHEFRSHVNKMVNNMEVTRETPPNKNSRTKIKHPIVKTFQMALFRAFTEAKVLVFVGFDSCPCFGKETISL